MEAKTGLRSSTIVKDLDVYCPKSHHLSHNIFLKVQTQGSKDSFYSKEFKPKDPKLTPLRDDTVELAKKEGEKKKKSQGHK